MFYLSSTCSSSRELPLVIAQLVNLGVRNIELSGNIRFSQDLRAQLRKFKAEFKLNLVLHNYFPPQSEDFVLNLASQDKTIQKKSFALVRDAHDWMEDFDIPLYGIHGGHNVDMRPMMVNYHFIVDQHTLSNKKDASKILYGHLSEIMQKIFKGKRRFAVENLTPKSKTENYALMATPDEIERFLDFSRSYENLGLLFDLGHFSVAGYMLGFDAQEYARYLLKNYRGKIFQMHLSDNDGTFDFHYVHKKDSWQLDILQEYVKSPQGGCATFEWDTRANKTSAIAAGVLMIQKRFGENVFTLTEQLK